jgi:hypothetical protein
VVVDIEYPPDGLNSSRHSASMNPTAWQESHVARPIVAVISGHGLRVGTLPSSSQKAHPPGASRPAPPQ